MMRTREEIAGKVAQRFQMITQTEDEVSQHRLTMELYLGEIHLALMDVRDLLVHLSHTMQEKA